MQYEAKNDIFSFVAKILYETKGLTTTFDLQFQKHKGKIKMFHLFLTKARCDLIVASRSISV